MLQRSLVLTAHGPRLAAGARTHLLGLGAVLLAAARRRASGSTASTCSTRRAGVVFGASYTDVHASLPGARVARRRWPLLCAGACVFQMFRPGWRFLVAGLVVLVVFVDRGPRRVRPRCSSASGSRPTSWSPSGPYIEHNIRMTRQAYALDRVVEKEFAADDNLDAAALERNSLTIKNVRLWDHRPLLTTYGKLQEIRTYYKFLDVDVDRYTVNGEYRQIMLSARELSYRYLPSRGWINEHLTYTHGYGLVAGPVNRISPEGLPEFFVKDIPPVGGGPARGSPGRRSTTASSSNEYVFVRTRVAGARLPLGRPERLLARYEGRGGMPVSLVPAASWPSRSASARSRSSSPTTSRRRAAS